MTRQQHARRLGTLLGAASTIAGVGFFCLVIGLAEAVTR